MSDWKAAALEHAKAETPREACGLLVIIKGRERYWPCKNLQPEADQFLLEPADYADAEDAGEIIAVVHSHPNCSPQPSEADKISAEKSGLIWHIVQPHDETWATYQPCGYQAPLVGRPWVWGFSDCWTLVRDWYRQEWTLDLRDWDRPVTPDAFNADPLFEQCYEATGFREMDRADGLKRGDALLMRLGTQGLSHCAVYLGDGMILQHVRGRLSSRDLYGGYYQEITGRVLRHISRI